MKNLLSLLLLSILVFSCSQKKEEKTGAEFSYIKAHQLLEKKDYAMAAEGFEKIDDEFPFSKWGVKGKTMAVYARYKNDETDKVLQIIEDFMRLNPNSDYVPYMMYMKGLSYYNQIPSIDRAQDDTQKASFTFRELIARFPESNYAHDAENKLEFIDEHLAGTKMAIGRNQMKEVNYIGAIENFKEVIRFYRQTNQLPEAYFRLAEIHSKIGLKPESERLIAEMKSRFPDNYWTKLAEKIEEKF